MAGQQDNDKVRLFIGETMLEHVFLLAVIALAFFWGAWRDYMTGNGRDSKLMVFLGWCMGMSSAGVYLAGV